MKGFTRTCRGLLCDADAEINYHGFWCVPCAWKKFGKFTIALEARYGDIHHMLMLQEVAPARNDGAAPRSGEDDSPRRRPGIDESAVRVGQSAPLTGSDRPKSFPSSGQEASTSGSLGASEPPAPLTWDDIDEIIQNDGWRELEWEMLVEQGILVRPFLAARLEDGTV